MDRVDWAKIWNLLLIAFPNRRENSEAEREVDTIELYLRLLGDLPTEAVKAAVLAHIGRSTFFPSIAEIRQGAVGILAGEQGLPLPHEAWAEVKAQVRSVGHYGQPAWSHPLIGKALDGAGGFQSFCMSDSDQEPSWRAQFLRAYEQLVSREREDQAMLPEVRRTMVALADKMRMDQKRIGSPSEMEERVVAG